MELKSYIRDIPDYPKAGVVFKDITTLWKDPAALKFSLDQLAEHCKGKGITKVVGAESRGFIIGTPLAYILGAGFIPARKPGKLPASKISKKYTLEYGEATIELHEDSLHKGDKVLIADDLLATGGTSHAIIELVEKLGGEIVECVYVVELSFLNGRELLKYPVYSLINY